MIHTISPKEAEALISGGQVDVVDVRGAGDWAAGHVPGARSVPLSELVADPRAALPHDGVVFICAKGVRSIKAAEAANAAGLEQVYSVEGGTSGWAAAGLGLVSEGGGI